MAIASWNGITFSVSSNKLMSFTDMSRNYAGRWKTHNIIGKRPKMEFLGADMDEISIEVVLDAEFGVKPLTEMKKFRSAAKTGAVAYFYVGGKKVVSNKMYVKSGTENWNEIWNRGELVRARAQITFGEYR